MSSVGAGRVPGAVRSQVPHPAAPSPRLGPAAGASAPRHRPVDLPSVRGAAGPSRGRRGHPHPAPAAAQTQCDRGMRRLCYVIPHCDNIHLITLRGSGLYAAIRRLQTHHISTTKDTKTPGWPYPGPVPPTPGRDRPQTTTKDLSNKPNQDRYVQLLKIFFSKNIFQFTRNII